MLRKILFIHIVFFALLFCASLASADQKHHKSHGFASKHKMADHACPLNHSHPGLPCPHSTKHQGKPGCHIGVDCGGLPLTAIPIPNISKNQFIGNYSIPLTKKDSYSIPFFKIPVFEFIYSDPLDHPPRSI